MKLITVPSSTLLLTEPRTTSTRIVLFSMHPLWISAQSYTNHDYFQASRHSFYLDPPKYHPSYFSQLNSDQTSLQSNGSFWLLSLFVHLLDWSRLVLTLAVRKFVLLFRARRLFEHPRNFLYASLEFAWWVNIEIMYVTELYLSLLCFLSRFNKKPFGSSVNNLWPHISGHLLFAGQLVRLLSSINTILVSALLKSFRRFPFPWLAHVLLIFKHPGLHPYTVYFGLVYPPTAKLWTN